MQKAQIVRVSSFFFQWRERETNSLAEPVSGSSLFCTDWQWTAIFQARPIMAHLGHQSPVGWRFIINSCNVMKSSSGSGECWSSDACWGRWKQSTHRFIIQPFWDRLTASQDTFWQRFCFRHPYLAFYYQNTTHYNVVEGRCEDIFDILFCSIHFVEFWVLIFICIYNLQSIL